MLLHESLEKVQYDIMHKEKPNCLHQICLCYILHVVTHFRRISDQTSKKGIFLDDSGSVKCFLIRFEVYKGDLESRVTSV